MTVEVLIAFAAACWLLAWTPGPSMALIVANTTSQGLHAGLWTLAGNGLGFVILLTAACLGMSSLVVLMAHYFDIIRWLGALYIAWLGFWRVYAAATGTSAMQASGPPRSGGSLFRQGFLVGISNPKTILFFGAFLPQFVNPAHDVPTQLALLAVTCVAVVMAGDVAYTFAVAALRRGFEARHLRFMDGIAGAMLLGVGLALAIMPRR